MNRPGANLLLEIQGVSKSYPLPTGHLEVLHGLSLNVYERDAICIMGSSGAGKSTLLHIMGTLDRPSSGKVLFRGKDLFAGTDDELAQFRNQKLGFVFQFHHLLAEFTALENVMMPCRIAGEAVGESRKKAESLLEELGLSSRKNHLPSEMSGGEQQRVAIARALVRNPEILLADEPTGNLDSANGLKLQELLFRIVSERGLTLIVVTHDLEFSRSFSKRLTMKDGRWIDVKTHFDRPNESR
ncbi:MAG: ABC transporter ATP-binding protein [Bdellovibrionales bacterium]|nr:ABC transporter ATP-binding protein [Bdellovibrionales bacterium]